jgi:hypothetical protein
MYLTDKLPKPNYGSPSNLSEEKAKHKMEEERNKRRTHDAGDGMMI